MASSTTNETVNTNEPQRAGGARWSRRALLGLGALGAAAKAEAQVRAPRRSRPAAVPSADMRLLHRVTYGPTSDDLTWMAALGYDGYLEWQLNHDVLGDPEAEARVAALTTVPLAPFSLYQADSAQVQRELAEAAIIRRTFSNRQLFERMVEFWTDHFTHQHRSGRHPQEPRGPRRVSRQRAGDVPADAERERVEPGDAGLSEQHAERRAPGRTPNQNYARELMELHTLGVNGGYTQQDVVEVARCFTGWRARGNTGTPTARAVLLRSDPPRQRQQAGAGRADRRRRRLQRRAQRADDAGESSQHRAVRLDQAAALAAHLRAVDRARERYRRRVHADQRQHQGAHPPHPVVRERAVGAAALQASVPPASSRRCA